MVKAFIDCLGWPTEKLLKKGLPDNVAQHFAIGPPLMLKSRELDEQGRVRVILPGCLEPTLACADVVIHASVQARSRQLLYLALASSARLIATRRWRHSFD